MEKTAKKWKLPISIFEFICYVVGGLVMAWGISYIIVGLVARFTAYNSVCEAANRSFKATFGLGFLGWGMIILGIGTLFVVIILCVYARSADREFEKNQRRAARLAQMKENRKEEAQVVDATTEEPAAPETPKE